MQKYGTTGNLGLNNAEEFLAALDSGSKSIPLQAARLNRPNLKGLHTTLDPDGFDSLCSRGQRGLVRLVMEPNPAITGMEQLFEFKVNFGHLSDFKLTDDPETKEQILTCVFWPSAEITENKTPIARLMREHIRTWTVLNGRPEFAVGYLGMTAAPHQDRQILTDIAHFVLTS